MDRKFDLTRCNPQLIEKLRVAGEKLHTSDRCQHETEVQLRESQHELLKTKAEVTTNDVSISKDLYFFDA